MKKGRYNDYDSFAWVYNKHWGSFSRGIIPVLEKVLLPHIPPKSNILDVCCGTGFLAHILMAQGYNITGIDGSGEMIKFARKNAPDANFIVEDAKKFTLPTHFNAAISLFDSLNHVMELEGLELVFKNIFSVLCPGGLFVFDLNMEEGFKKRWEGAFNIVEDDHVCAIRSSYDTDKRIGKFDITILRFIDQWNRYDITLLQKCYSEEDIILAMKRAGFENIQTLDAIADLGRKDVGRTFFLGKK